MGIRTHHTYAQYPNVRCPLVECFHSRLNVKRPRSLIETKQARGLILGFSDYAALLQQHILGRLGVQHSLLDAQIVQSGAKRLLAGIPDWFQFPGTFLPVPCRLHSVSFGE